MHGRSAERGAGEGEDCVCYSISAKAPKISYIVENVVNELSAPIKRSQVAGSQVAGSCQQVTVEQELSWTDRQSRQVGGQGDRRAGGCDSWLCPYFAATFRALRYTLTFAP